MKSRVLPLPEGAPPWEAVAGSTHDGNTAAPDPGGGEELGGEPDLVLAFLPPHQELPRTLDALARRFPASRLAGCEAVTQFAGDRTTTAGALHLFRFEEQHSGVDLLTFQGSETAGAGQTAADDATDAGAPTGAERIDLLARRLAGGDPVLLLGDGLECSLRDHVSDLRRALARHLAGSGGGTLRPLAAGGLASQELPSELRGARVFRGRRVLDGGCLAVVFRGVDAVIRVVRGWDPASPVYRVTRAEDDVLYEIEGEAATEWYRRFFTVGGKLAPMPQTAHRFPLILEGPEPSRNGLYRSMRAFDEPPGAVTFWGDLETGDRVRLGMGNEESLVEKAAEEGALAHVGSTAAAILYSCVGREQVLGGAAGEEVRAVEKALGGTPLSGFFSFGEVGPTDHGGPAFYNHTAILVLLTERAGGGPLALAGEAP